MKKLLYSFCILIVINSCAKEDVNPNDYREKEAIHDNIIELRDHTTMVSEDLKSQILAVNALGVVVADGPLASKKVGDILVNLADGQGTDSLSFFRKITGVRKEGNRTIYITEQATWSQAYEKWSIDSRSDKFTVKSRNLAWNENYEFNATSFAKISGDYELDPNLTIDFRYDDFYFTSFFDSTIIANANSLDDINPAFHLVLKNFKLELSGNVNFGAHVSIGKDVELGDPLQILVIPETGLSLYFLPKMGYSVNLEGRVSSPVITSEFGGYDIELKYNVWDEVPEYTILKHPPGPEDLDNPGWQIEGSGQVELQGGAELFVSLTGEPTFLKAGVFLFNYLHPGISHKGDLENLQPEYDLTFEIGAGMSFFYGFPLFEDYLDFSWSSDDYKYPLWTYVYRDFPCTPFSNALLEFNSSTGLFDLRVGSTDRPLGAYNVSVNDVPITNLGNADFAYNTDYILNTSLPSDPINKIIIADKRLVGCYLEDNFVELAAFGDCTETVTDQEGNQYCTLEIGQLTWMTENLRRSDYGVSYPGLSSGEARLYGRLYTFEDVLAGSNEVSTRIQGICPDGWHLPSQSEWGDLINTLGGHEEAGKNFKYPSNALWPSSALPSSPTFNAVSAGEHYAWRGTEAVAFGNRGKLARFWTTKFDARNEGVLIVEVTNRERISENNVTNADPAFYHSVKEAGYSCRCVQDY